MFETPKTSFSLEWGFDEYQSRIHGYYTRVK